jgi:anti-sigma factor RsiW
MIGVDKTVGLRCFLLRSSLVSFADGTLGEAVRDDVERHLAKCPRCAEDVVALREVPALLRRSAASPPDEAFWARQRASIARTVAVSAPPRTIERRPLRWWLAPALAAMALLLVVRTWNPALSVTPTGAPVTPEPASDEAVPMLVEEPAPVVPEDFASADDATMASLRASLDDEIGGVADASLI